MIPMAAQYYGQSEGPTYLTNEVFRTLYVCLSDKANQHCMVSAGLTVGSGMSDLTSQTAESFTVIYQIIPMAA